MSFRFPIVIVTAIVSPSARPNERTVAPKIPARAAGRTTFQTVSHQVAPIATLASRSPPGTALMTSREIELRVGRIMMARMIEAIRGWGGEGGGGNGGTAPRRWASGWLM